jgi:hypothetical protein
MNVPLESDILFSLEYYKTCKKDKYFIIAEVLDFFFLIQINNEECNLSNLFAWIYTEQIKRNKKFLNKPIKSTFNSFYKSKYKSLISNKGDKLLNIIRSIKDFSSFGEINIFMSKDEIKRHVKKIVYDSENSLLQEYINDDINLTTLNNLNTNVKIRHVFQYYNLLNFLLTFEVPYVIKDDIFIFLFERKEINKFIIDFRFLYNVFFNYSSWDVLFLLSVLKKYLQC